MIRRILLFSTLSLFSLQGIAEDVSVVVDAKANSSSGGAGKDTNIDVIAGDVLAITISPKDTWSAGSESPCTRTSNADGLTQCYGKYTQGNLSANYGSLVGRIGNGKYFFIGTKFRKSMPTSGRLYLYYWDSNSGDNSGSVRASVTIKGGNCAKIKAHIDQLSKEIRTNGNGRTLKQQIADNRWTINIIRVRQDEIDIAIENVQGGRAELKRLQKENEQQSINPYTTTKVAAKGGSMAASRALLTKTASRRVSFVAGFVVDGIEAGYKAGKKYETDKTLREYLKTNLLQLQELTQLHRALSADLNREYARQHALKALKVRWDNLWNRWANCKKRPN